MGEQRFVVTDEICMRLEPHLPGKKSDSGVTGKDNRLFVEAMLWRVRTGLPWRDLPSRLLKKDFAPALRRKLFPI